MPPWEQNSACGMIVVRFKDYALQANAIIANGVIANAAMAILYLIISSGGLDL